MGASELDAAAGPFVAVSRFTVANGMTSDVKAAFRNRPGYVDDQRGFLRMEVISPLDNLDEIWLMTFWEDRESYEAWHGSSEWRRSQQFIPKGLKVFPGSATVTFFEHVTS